jgi:arylsulfatase A-like enzyme
MTHELPDIVLVVFDTARWDRFGCYGYDRPTTPTVDRLANEGLLIESMVANAPWTLPSHASLFTGLYPAQHGAQWQTGLRLRESVPITMAQWLRARGYKTVCATNNGLISSDSGLARGFERYGFRLDLERGPRRMMRRARKALLGGDSGGRVVNQWLHRELRSVSESEPLFLFVNYTECHWAYVPPPMLVRRVGGPRFRTVEGLRYRLGLADRVGPWEAIARANERELDIYSTLYDAEHRNADAHLADLLVILRETGHLRTDSTIVMVTSDHGEHIGEHGLADHHASLDDHLVRVPFVAWGPGIVPRLHRTELYEFVDVLPSLSRLMGAGLPAECLSGRRTDLFGSSDGNGEANYAFAEWRAWGTKEAARLMGRNPSYDFAGLDRDLVSVRDQRYKLVRSSRGEETIHDLLTDPGEESNVSVPPEITKRLRDRLDAAVASWDAWDVEEEAIPEQQQLEIERHLSELGYI